MKLFLLLSLLLPHAFALAYKAEFPEKPETKLTPGSLCDRPDEYRYQERIAYCKRDVSTNLKYDVMNEYREEGYRLNMNNRSSYKIDHFIPLCAGGSNNENNLWPQHITVFTITDPIESRGCEKLKAGKITQVKLIELIREVKLDLSKAQASLRMLERL